MNFSFETTGFPKPGNVQSLIDRKKTYQTFFEEEYGKFRRDIAERNLTNQSSWEIMLEHSDWMDSWVNFSLSLVLEEKDALVRLMVGNAGQEINFLHSSVEKLVQQKDRLETLLFTPAGEPIPMEPVERDYYLKTLKDLEVKLESSRKSLRDLEEIRPSLADEGNFENDAPLDVLVIFARGGYGRRELSFTSDIDLGYCLNVAAVSKVRKQIIQEMIRRLEEIFQELPLIFGSQYFELGEDLSRFAKRETLHTIPSILEARAILGSERMLGDLKDQITAIVPQDQVARYLTGMIRNRERGKNYEFNIKEGYGGLRHIQTALWLVLVLCGEKDGETNHLLRLAQDKGWISDKEKERILLAWEFYFDLRNFLGLYDCYHTELGKIGAGKLVFRGDDDKNFLDDQGCLAYLKLRERFLSVDFLDRFRMASIKTVAELSAQIADHILDRNITESIGEFRIVKNQGRDEIIELIYPGKGGAGEDEAFGDFFLDYENLFALFIYISNTGNTLSRRLSERFSHLVDPLYQSSQTISSEVVRDGIIRVFVGDNASAALGQMFDISSPMSRDGYTKTLLGRFLPEVNKMRFILRNVTVHELPLCEHSLKAVAEVENEALQTQKNEPELWAYIDETDVFALKWSTLFHDIGKIDPYRDHEEQGPLISTKMLARIGWNENHETLNLIRLLVRHHQTVVRYSQLSTYIDIGIVKFLELAQRDPKKLILLYLVNLCDFKSVNREMKFKTGKLEKLFEETMKILYEHKGRLAEISMSKIVNDYFDRKKKDLKQSVWLQLLLQQCIHKNLDQAVFSPLEEMAPEEAESLAGQKKTLREALRYLSLGGMDKATVEKHSSRFTQIVMRFVSMENIEKLVGDGSANLDWFFSAFPNRYLFSSYPDVLSNQLYQFENFLTEPVIYSFVNGSTGEYSTVIFHCMGDEEALWKIAFQMGRRKINIESGKVNRIDYGDGKRGFSGSLQISRGKKSADVSSIGLQNAYSNLEVPRLKIDQSASDVPTNIQVQYYLEREKGYVIRRDRDRYTRDTSEYVATKISLDDAPFALFRILMAFSSLEVYPRQITITTIGKKIIDYFYILPEEKEKLVGEGFEERLSRHMTSEISWAGDTAAS